MFSRQKDHIIMYLEENKHDFFSNEETEERSRKSYEILIGKIAW